MKDQYYILISKLDKFIKKYYANQLIKGAIYSISLMLVFFLTVNIVEYFGHFNSTVRTVLAFLFIASSTAVITRYILIPLFSLIRIGKRLSHEQAASVIGRHFPEVSDKLLNTLQLKKLSELQRERSDLLEASIDQKVNEMKPVPFQSAIDFRVNKRYLKYPIVPILLIALIIIISPGMITEPSTRLVNYTTHFERALPYRIDIVNDKLQAIQNEDFVLHLKVEGEEIPSDIFIETGSNAKMRPVRENAVKLNYRFVNVQDDINFRIVTDQYKSDLLTLEVLPKPVILDFEISLDYPAYTGKRDETVRNNGDLLVPVGSEITWNFSTRNTEQISISFGGKKELLEQSEGAYFTHKDRFYESSGYTIKSANKYLENRDSLNYSIQVVPDLYPVIVAEEYQDSLYDSRLYFRGTIRDDYGFNQLTFNTINKENNQRNVDTLEILQGVNPQQYYHYFDVAAMELSPGQSIEYYFEVWDNDGINGSKSTRSQVMNWQVPTMKEIEEAKEKSNEDIKEKMEETIKEVKGLEKDIEEVSKKLIDKKELNWEDKEQIKQLLQKQKSLQSKMEEIKKENVSKSLKENQYKEIDEQILEKQRKLEELMEELMKDEEFSELLKKLEELMEELDKDEINEMLEEMKFSNEELEEMLDRNLELFKQLEFEQKLEETINKLEALAEKQEKLAEKSEDRKQDSDALLKEQKKLGEEFKELQKDIEQLDQMNSELEDPNEFDTLEEEQSDVNEEMENSEENLEKGKKNKASDSQENAAGKMQKMAQKMQEMQQQMIQQSMGEDIESLRSILENLIRISFDQEELMARVDAVNINDPQYTGLIQEQNKLKNDAEMVEDSLIALSKRQIMIEPFVTKEIREIDNNIEKSVDFLNKRRPREAASRQQFVMTSVNNLALMLSETLNQMMQMMQMPANASCKNSGMPKPGQGKGQSTVKSMRQLQEQLNKQLEQMKNGEKPNGQKQKGLSPGGQSMSEQLARTAAQQEYIRNELRKLSDQMEKEGEFGSSKELKRIMEEMEKSESDLVNKMISEETLMRQKQILTRLLKSEKAEMEREKEERRESTEAKSQKIRNPDEIFKYKKELSNEVELLETVPPSLKPFYKNKVNQYFFNFEELLEQ